MKDPVKNLPRHVHLIGIGGTGMSAIARVLLESGWTVSGSDRQVSPLAEQLREAGARVFIGHHPENIAGAGWVVRSSAVPDDNVEVQAARQAGVPVLKRADFLAELMANKRGIAVAGAHGKTTTTAMIAWMLVALGEEPSFIAGSILENLGVNARAGQGPDFVIEADEYDRMFLGLRPQIAVVTNVEHDHPDCYPSKADFFAAFRAFVDRLPPDGLLLACGDDPGARDLAAQAGLKSLAVRTYGLEEQNHYRAVDLRLNEGGGLDFTLRLPEGSELADPVGISLQIPGRHNVLNALAALAVAHRLNLPLDGATEALNAFRGTRRRFQLLGEAGGVVLVDDYAHHPTEVRATLAAARLRYPQRRLWAVWQPHTYSRTRTLLADFAGAFEAADRVVVTEIYPAREQPPQDGFSARDVVSAMSHPQVVGGLSLEETERVLLDELQPGDVVLVLSAGDADRVTARVFQVLRERVERAEGSRPNG